MFLLTDLLHWVLPWDFSPTVLICCGGCAWLFARGAALRRRAGTPIAAWRHWAFYSGVALLYVPLQTRYDYLAQHMFWMHRLQHLLLHDMGSLLFALAVPWSLLAEGLPVRLRAVLFHPALRVPVSAVYRVLRRPSIAFVLFVGLTYFWLWPSIHFKAMLSLDEYKCMNWSVALDGLLFWSLILDPRSRREGAPIGLGGRIVLTLVAMVPETIIGAFLSLHLHTIYTVYDVCGRLWPVDPVTDQQIGGLITWIPASMMDTAAALLVLARWIHADERARGGARMRGRGAAVAVELPH